MVTLPSALSDSMDLDCQLLVPHCPPLVIIISASIVSEIFSLVSLPWLCVCILVNVILCMFYVLAIAPGF